jgi:hypothetical protein
MPDSRAEVRSDDVLRVDDADDVPGRALEPLIERSRLPRGRARVLRHDDRDAQAAGPAVCKLLREPRRRYVVGFRDDDHLELCGRVIESCDRSHAPRQRSLLAIRREEQRDLLARRRRGFLLRRARSEAEPDQRKKVVDVQRQDHDEANRDERIEDEQLQLG